MATAQDLAELSKSPLFQERVKYYLTKAAIAVHAEAYGGTGQPTAAEHELRIAFAQEVLKGNYNIVEVCRGVMTNDTIRTKFLADDNIYGDIEFVVNSVFDAFAGVDKGVNQGV